MNLSTPLDFALAYAQAGYRVFPLHTAENGICTCRNPKCESPGKHPRTGHGSLDATTDPQQITQWWTKTPAANIGMTLENLVVIDVDPRNGGDLTFEALVAKYGQPTDTCYAHTGGGGWHYLYRVNSGAEYPGDLGAGVDVKHGKGAYIVVEPSIHASGQKYGWLDESEPWGMTPAPAMSWLAKNKTNGSASPENADQVNSGRGVDWLDSILHGNALHDSLRNLAARYSVMGLEFAEICKILETAMSASTAHRDERWQARYDRIPALVNSAVVKFRQGAAAADEATPNPIDILRRLAAPPLRIIDVPPVLGAFANAHAKATGFDVSIILTGGLIAAATMLADDVRLCVSPRSGWFESARLWAVPIAGPGSGKSPGLKIALAPLFAVHRELLDDWTRQHSTEEHPPAVPTIFTSDATTEALSDLLCANERGLLYFVDELESWLASHDTYRSGGGKDRGEWLRLYDGGPHQVNRVKRGAVFVPNWGVSLLSATTPSALRKLAPKLPDDGLLQRLLLILAQPRQLPDETMARIDTKPQTEAWDCALRRIYDIPKHTVHLSGAAGAAFAAEQTALHGLTLAFEDLHPSYASHLAKRGAMLARVALVFHALGENDSRADLSGETMALAVNFMARQERHAMAIYGEMLGADTGITLARAIARSILASQLDSFNRRDLTHSCKAFRGADEGLRQAALSLLADCGWLSCSALTIQHGAIWMVDKRVHVLFSDHSEAAVANRALVRSRIIKIDEHG